MPEPSEPFAMETLPPLGATVEIKHNTEFPNGTKFAGGESAIVCEHHLAADGTLYIAARTDDGRIYRSATAEAFSR